MAPPIVPTGEPAQIRAGDTVVFDIFEITHPDLGTFGPGQDWTLTYELVAGSNRIAVTPVETTTGWRTTITAAETSDLKDGTTKDERIRWTLTATSLTSERYTLRSGLMAFFVDPATAVGGTQSYAAAKIEAIQAQYDALLASGGVHTYALGGRSVMKDKLRELRIELDYWKQVLSGERNPTQFGRRVQWRMTPISS